MCVCDAHAAFHSVLLEGAKQIGVDILLERLRSIVAVRIGIRLKLPRVVVARRLGHERRCQRLVEEPREVQAAEPLVLPHVVAAALQVAQPLRAVGREQLAHEIARVRLDEARELDLPGEDELVDAKGVLVVEWRVSVVCRRERERAER